ncbi:hypothetical protein XENTR_v10017103 [Xenopus tropicalis]|nr:hypothetical protein XENTR_v10017103 [Xenopus tropicalis]
MRKSLQPARPVRRVVMHKGPMFPTGPMAPSVLKNLSLKQEKLCRATSLDSEPLFMLNIRTEFTDYLIHDIEKHLDMPFRSGFAGVFWVIVLLQHPRSLQLELTNRWPDILLQDFLVDSRIHGSIYHSKPSRS